VNLSRRKIVLTTWADGSRREKVWRASAGPFLTAHELVDAAMDLRARIEAGDLGGGNPVYALQAGSPSGRGIPWLMSIEVLETRTTDHAHPENDDDRE
jgi:hypothetical protein